MITVYTQKVSRNEASLTSVVKVRLKLPREIDLVELRRLNPANIRLNSIWRPRLSRRLFIGSHILSPPVTAFETRRGIIDMALKSVEAGYAPGSIFHTW